MTGFFSLLLKPFENGNAYGGLIFISVVTGIVMLWLYKLTSNQRALKTVKNRIGAYFLEMRLYKDDFVTVRSSIKSIFMTNLQYMKLALVPAIVMIVPVLLIMVQLNLRYAHSGLERGSSTLVKVKFQNGVDVLRKDISISVSEGLIKETAPVRIGSLNEVDWRIGVLRDGIHKLKLSVEGSEMEIPIVATTKVVPCYASLMRDRIWTAILNPGAPRIPPQTEIVSIEVKYPKRSFNWGLFSLSWLWSFLIISMASGFILKSALRVE